MPKNKTFNPKKFIKSLVALGERQGEVAKIATDLIVEQLNNYNLSYRLEDFPTYLPVTKKAKLIADDQKIPCLSSSFISGQIANQDHLLSSLISSQENIDTVNINFNPRSKTISRSNFYFAPSLSIKSKDLLKVIKAKSIKGEVIVKKTKKSAYHILVGNIKNPSSVIFSHFDSIGSGAIDNASGVTVVLQTILNNPKILEKNLFVFDGNEELSYDYPIYWGHGFRVFENKYKKTLTKTKKIIVVDSLGNGPTQLQKNSPYTKLAFPIKNLNSWQKKIYLLYGDINNLMPVYHSDLDDLKQINFDEIRRASIILSKHLNLDSR